MPLFNYRAVDLEGAEIKGTIEEGSAQRVTDILREQGYQVNAVEEVRPRFALPRLRQRLTWEDIDLLNEHMLAITQSGLPLSNTLKALAEDLHNRRLRRVLSEMHTTLDEGGTIDEALRQYPESFSDVYRSMVRAGEKTGNLAGVFGYLSTFSSRMLEIKYGLQEALAYPIVVICFALIIVTFLLLKVVPVFAEIFADFGGELPWPTRFVVDASKNVMQSWPMLAVVAAGFVVAGRVGAKFLRHTGRGRYLLDKVFLMTPLLGRRCKVASLAQFSRALGMLLAAGVPVRESLDLAAAAAGNAVLSRKVREAAELVDGGEALSVAFEKTRFFGFSYCWLLGTAEGRGDVDQALLRQADSYDKQLVRRDRLIVSMTAPLGILAVGCIIGFIILALFLPIFTLGDAISG